jgi:hypothetical protein
MRTWDSVDNFYSFIDEKYHELATRSDYEFRVTKSEYHHLITLLFSDNLGTYRLDGFNIMASKGIIAVVPSLKNVHLKKVLLTSV